MTKKLKKHNAPGVRACDWEPEPRDWRGWTLDGHYLEYPAYKFGTYPVDLERCCTPAQMLDYIFQVSMKTWATDDCRSGLINALWDIFNPQATLCSFGQSKTVSKQKLQDLLDSVNNK